MFKLISKFAVNLKVWPRYKVKQTSHNPDQTLNLMNGSKYLTRISLQKINLGPLSPLRKVNGLILIWDEIKNKLYI